MKATLLSLLLACSPSVAEPTEQPTPVKQKPIFYPQPIEACRDSIENGLWADDCDVEWCLPPEELQLVFSVNLGLHAAYGATQLPNFGRAYDPKACVKGAWRVFRLEANSEYRGDNLFMVDPVRSCDGLSCLGAVIDGWAVSDRSRLLYFLTEVFSSSL